MFIVIDTTETFQHPLLTSPDWSYVQSLLKRDVATLVVPEIVIAETINHFPTKLTEALSETQRAIGRLKKLIPTINLKAEDVEINAATEQYKDALHARLKELHAQTPGFKDIEIDRIVRRSLEHRKPFDANGQRGLRDAILWETVLDLIRTKDTKKIVVVTRNTTDFGPHDGLAPDLREDLTKLNIDNERVKICNGLRTFSESYVKPSLIKLDELQTQIQEQSYELFDVDDFYADAFHEIILAAKDQVRQWDFQELGSITRRSFEAPRLLNLNESPDDFEVGEVYRIEDGEVAFSITFTIKGTIECDEIHDYDPMERPWTTEFVGEATFSVETSQVMEESTGHITEFTVESVKVIPGIRWPCDQID